MLTAILFLAGFTTLLYEVTWFRMMSLMLGATTRASVVVLAGFMTGMGIGAGYWGNRTMGKQPIKTQLTVLFSGAAISNLVFYFLHKPVILNLYTFSSATSLGFINVAVMIVSIVFLAVPAFFIGGILPLSSALMRHRGLTDSKITGQLYAAETFGSVAGGLISGFILLGMLGQQLTFIIAASINLLTAFVLPGLKEQGASPDDDSAMQPSLNITLKNNTLHPALLLSATFVFGFSVMALQVLWIRIFKIYFTNTSYSFALIASVVVMGLFAGSTIFTRTFSTRTAGSRSLFRVLIFTALTTLAGLIIVMRLPQMIIFPIASGSTAYFSRIIVLPLIASLLIVFPVTLLSGYAFPLICTLYNQSRKRIGQSVGHVLFWNTLGSVAGPVFAAYILIPLIGQAWSLVAISSVLIFMGWRVVKTYSRSKIYSLMPLLSLALLSVALMAPQIKILPPSFSRFDKQVLDYKETLEGTYIVAREPGKNAVLSTYVNNSAVIGSSYDAIKVVKMVGHLPFFAGLNGDKALVVGFGIGVTASAIASHPEISQIDCIELVKGLGDAAHYYSGLNADIQHDPRVNMIGGDGRQFLLTTGNKYHLISSDPTHPVLGSGSLYTRDYFELCKQHLLPGGMVSQYLPLHKLRLQDFLGIIKTFHSVFPNATVWLGMNHAVLLSAAPYIDFGQWSARVASLQRDPYFYGNPYSLAANLLFDGSSIAAFDPRIPINTDDRSYTEFFNMSAFDENNLANNLNYVNQHRADVSAVFRNVPDSMMMQRFVNRNRLLTDAISANISGNSALFRQKLIEAIKANPENEELPFLLKFYFK